MFVDLADSPCVAKLQIDSPAVSDALCILAIHDHVLRRFARADPDKATAARNAVSRVTRRITVATPSSETREARFGVVS